MYLSSGLFAEGSSDYEFLPALLDRLLPVITARLYPGADVSPTLSLRAPLGTKGSRADKIAAAVRDRIEQFQLLIIHSDGKNRPAVARKNEVDPGIAAVAQLDPQWPIFPVACVPVWEIEAWMLTDPAAFRTQFGIDSPALPKDPGARPRPEGYPPSHPPGRPRTPSRRITSCAVREERGPGHARGARCIPGLPGRPHRGHPGRRPLPGPPSALTTAGGRMCAIIAR